MNYIIVASLITLVSLASLIIAPEAINKGLSSQDNKIAIHKLEYPTINDSKE